MLTLTWVLLIYLMGVTAFYTKQQREMEVEDFLDPLSVWVPYMWPVLVLLIAWCWLTEKP